MTKCAGCRVRHLSCDTHSTCTECEENGRECVRLNVRFRHLVCPSGRITRADYSKYEFFFDGDQTWMDTNGNLEFVAGSDRADAAQTDELENHVFDAVSRDASLQPALVEQPSSRIDLGSTSHIPTIRASVLEDDPSDYLPPLEQVTDDPACNVLIHDASKMPARLLKEASQLGEKLPSNMSVSYLEKELPAQELAWPLKSLQEGKLLQHFATHLAPWVCTNVFLVP